jgi:hypothetical protein
LADDQQRFSKNLGAASKNKLAEKWGVTTASLDALGIGFTTEKGGAFTFPMRDADRRIVGFRLRYYDDTSAKGCIDGGHLGLLIPDGVTPGNCEADCEGESDLAAALSVGIKAIGVPGAGNATDEAARFFAKSAVSCPCIIGDNDGAGEDGIEKLRAALLASGIPCRRLKPPDGIHDFRDWCATGVPADELRRIVAKAEVFYPEKWPHGFRQLPNAAARRGLVGEIGPGPFALAGLIASFCGADGTGFPDREKLAELCKVSISTIDRWNGVLADAGVLVWEKGHKGKANVYRVNFGPYQVKRTKI